MIHRYGPLATCEAMLRIQYFYGFHDDFMTIS